MLQKIIGMLFNEAVRRMVGAFEARARQLCGAPGGASCVRVPTAGN
jgi:coenzyme Q-binding protein COQ10